MTRISHLVYKVFAAAISIFLTVNCVGGQSFQGSIRGAVSDPAGAVIPGAAIVLTNQETSITRTILTNERGLYSFEFVPPGTYRIAAQFSGFKSYDLDNLILGTAQSITSDIQLAIGQVRDTVEVKDEPPLVDTATANNAQYLSASQLNVLPNFGRNPFVMSTLVANVTHVGDPAQVDQDAINNSSLLAVAGGPVQANSYVIDGVPVTDLRNRSPIIPSLEAISELKMQTNTYDAEVGRTGGGVFNTTFKSGTNFWHGSGFVQQRPDFLAANDWFANQQGIARPSFRHWLYGGSVGGPIQRNKTFLWAAVENLIDSSGATAQFRVPTEAERQGDFSKTFDPFGRQVIIYDPLTTRPDPANPGNFIRDAFPNNVIPLKRIDPVGQSFINMFAKPAGVSGSAGSNNYAKSTTDALKAYQYSAKLDHTFNDRHAMSVTYAWRDSRYHLPLFSDAASRVADGDNATEIRPAYLPIFNYTYTPGSRSVLNLRFGYDRFTDSYAPGSAGVDLSSLGFSSRYTNSVKVKTFPAVILTGDNYPRLGLQDDIDALYTSTNFIANYSTLIGRQNIRIGGMYRGMGLSFFARYGDSGYFIFSKGYTQGDPLSSAPNSGSTLASLLLGAPVISEIAVDTPLNFFARYYAGYLQDDVRLTHRLTLNAGLRYEFEAGLAEKNNHTTVGFDRSVVNPLAAKVQDPSIRDRIRGGLVYARDGHSQQGTSRLDQFAPRLGLVWNSPGGFVVRGGYGLYFAPLQPPYPIASHYGSLGFSSLTAQPSSTNGGLSPSIPLNDPFPSGISQPTGNQLGLLQNVGSDVTFIDQNTKQGYIHQFSIDVQREFHQNLLISAGYVGSRSESMPVAGTGAATVDYNQLTTDQLSLGPALFDSVSNPFYGIPEAGPLGLSPTTTRGQLLRPYPEFQSVLAYRPASGIARYNAFNLRAELKPGKSGLSLLAHYVFSKNLDNYFGQSNSFAFSPGAVLNNYDLRREYSYSITDSPHNVLVSPVYQLPFGRNRRWVNKGVAEQFAGGWSIATIATFQSGFPAAITQDLNNTNSFGGAQRPNLVLGQSPCSSGGTEDRLNQWFNLNAFTEAAPFTFGNLARTISCRTPFRSNWDFALQKTFIPTESIKTTLKIEANNGTNTPKFAGPDATFGSSTFGRITSQIGYPRRIQWMLRMDW